MPAPQIKTVLRVFPIRKISVLLITKFLLLHINQICHVFARHIDGVNSNKNLDCSEELVDTPLQIH